MIKYIVRQEDVLSFKDEACYESKRVQSLIHHTGFTADFITTKDQEHHHRHQCHT